MRRDGDAQDDGDVDRRVVGTELRLDLESANLANRGGRVGKNAARGLGVDKVLGDVSLELRL